MSQGYRIAQYEELEAILERVRAAHEDEASAPSGSNESSASGASGSSGASSAASFAPHGADRVERAKKPSPFSSTPPRPPKAGALVRSPVEPTRAVAPALPSTDDVRAGASEDLIATYARDVAVVSGEGAPLARRAGRH